MGMSVAAEAGCCSDLHLRLLALLERADSDAATKHDDEGGERRAERAEKDGDRDSRSGRAWMMQ